MPTGSSGGAIEPDPDEDLERLLAPDATLLGWSTQAADELKELKKQAIDRPFGIHAYRSADREIRSRHPPVDPDAVAILAARVKSALMGEVPIDRHLDLLDLYTRLQALRDLPPNVERLLVLDENLREPISPEIDREARSQIEYRRERVRLVYARWLRELRADADEPSVLLDDGIVEPLLGDLGVHRLTVAVGLARTGDRACREVDDTALEEWAIVHHLRLAESSASPSSRPDVAQEIRADAELAIVVAERVLRVEEGQVAGPATEGVVYSYLCALDRLREKPWCAPREQLLELARSEVGRLTATLRRPPTQAGYRRATGTGWWSPDDLRSLFGGAWHTRRLSPGQDGSTASVPPLAGVRSRRVEAIRRAGVVLTRDHELDDEYPVRFDRYSEIGALPELATVDRDNPHRWLRLWWEYIILTKPALAGKCLDPAFIRKHFGRPGDVLLNDLLALDDIRLLAGQWVTQLFARIVEADALPDRLVARFSNSNHPDLIFAGTLTIVDEVDIGRVAWRSERSKEQLIVAPHIVAEALVVRSSGVDLGRAAEIDTKSRRAYLAGPTTPWSITRLERARQRKGAG